MSWQTERRREPRFTLKTPVWVECGSGRRMVATTRDISDHGLGLWIAGSGIGGGETVRVRFQDEEFPARVRYSQGGEKVDESTLGLEVEQGMTDRQVHALLALASLA